MIIVQIKGGLGNQLFSYAAAFGIAQENNTELIIDRYIYDTSYFLRRYMLGSFPNIDSEHLMNFIPTEKKTSQLYYRLIRKIKLKFLLKAHEVFEEEEFKYKDIVTKGENLYLNGYWQSYLFFDKYRDDIIEKFRPFTDIDRNCSAIIEEIERCNSVAVHIRRGDYVSFKGGKCLDISYYREAMVNLTNLKQINVVFYIFTDDIEYCKSSFASVNNVKFVAEETNLTDIEEFSLMTKCKDFIIGNSTFSWWAAYLASAKDKVVIAPVVDMWKEEFYLPEWIKIKANLQ